MKLLLSLVLLGWTCLTYATDYQRIDPLEGWNYDDAELYSINDHGQVVGTFDRDFESFPFLWDPETGVTLLTLPEEGMPCKINNRGQIAGITASINGSDMEGFFWDPKKGLTMLTRGHDISFYPMDLNENGEILCLHIWDTMGQSQDFALWDGTWHSIDVGGEACFLLSLNDQGEVAGMMRTPQDAVFAVKWCKGQTQYFKDTVGMHINNAGEMLVKTEEDGYFLWDTHTDTKHKLEGAEEDFLIARNVRDEFLGYEGLYRLVGNQFVPILTDDDVEFVDLNAHGWVIGNEDQERPVIFIPCS